ncbi:achaete-scute complex protein T5 [Culex quinquefasciatus]|uniref:BHLH domain-containing protein n=1 Tax=Culex quinquefasciatus TaxID=7176 RepID=A0A1S4JNE2_CULQU|nr:achaete-scute complex protein T5 [Culex quinquefasciatus]
MATVARSMSMGQNIYMTSTVPQPSSMPYRKRPIAPAPVTPTTQPPPTQFKDRPMIGKKYCPTSLPYAVTPQQSVSIQRRNARERNRVKQVNNGFANLRQHIPSTVVTALTNGGRGPHKKLSKVDTLKVAVKYIRSMQRMLEEDIENNGTSESTSTKLDSQALSPVSFYGSMSESSTSSSPAPSQLSEYSSYSSQPELTPTFKREPYDLYPTPPTSATTVLPSMTTFTSPALSTATYSAPMHHVYKVAPLPLPVPIPSYTHEEMSPQNTDDEELLDAISWWQQQQ